MMSCYSFFFKQNVFNLVTDEDSITSPYLIFSVSFTDPTVFTRHRVFSILNVLTYVNTLE